MVKIILSHKKNFRERWPLFRDKDAKKVIEDVWIQYIKDSPDFLKTRKLASVDDLPCLCNYPPDPDKRPINPEFFKLYHGCIFDLDAYIEGKDDYLKEEINSLPSTIYAGGVSKKEKKFYSEPIKENWYCNPITDEIELALYLKMILILIRATIDEDFKETFYQETLKELKAKKQEYPMVV